jgi:PAS domain-containing protein
MIEKLQSALLEPKTDRQFVHDLRAHQIELEIQNEELRGLQQELEASKSRYKELYDYAPAGHITVSEQGLIVEGNRTAARLLNVGGKTLVGQTFFRFILAEDQDMRVLCAIVDRLRREKIITKGLSGKDILVAISCLPGIVARG